MTHRVDELDQHEFDLYADIAAEDLRLYRFTLVELQPGDGTRYPISIVMPPTPEQHVRRRAWRDMHPDEPIEAGGVFFVSTAYGPMYQWHGTTVSWDYVLEKWVQPSASANWTARVLSRFLNTLSPIVLANAISESFTSKEVDDVDQ